MSSFETSFVFSGASAETFRLFEAASAGCIIVHDILPDVWYYENLPYLPLPKSGECVLGVKEYIEKNKTYLKTATGKWWQQSASPVAVGQKIAATAKLIGL